VRETSGTRLGRVTDLIETGGTDVLVVEDDDGDELLIPMAREMIRKIDARAGRIEVRLPEGLRELNREERRR
jgi:16S rRNA processing protein RimM